MTHVTQFCDSCEYFKLKHVIDNRNIEIVDYEYIKWKIGPIKFKSSDSLSKKYCFYLKLMFLTAGKLLAFKLAFSRLSLWDLNWTRLFTSFGFDIITKISSMDCHDNCVLFGHTYLFPALTIYFKHILFINICNPCNVSTDCTLLFFTFNIHCNYFTNR